MEGLNFGGIWLHALCREHSTIEGDLRLPDLTLQAVEDNAMLLWLSASAGGGIGHAPQGYNHRHIYHHVWHDNAKKMVCCLVQFVSKRHVLGLF